ncbi:hypothetical protein ACIQUL_09045 [Streptomyces sp. NPDC090303]|uniref:hypothetical protein n=1 Tax=Streptomyces sp. NPDC090303 TaxID=3365960 RepID=UPI0037F5D7E6
MKRTTLPRLCASSASGHVPPVDFRTNGHAAYAATTSRPLLDAIPTPRRQITVTARFVQATLPTGTKMLHEYEGGVLVGTYDPAQLSALDARLLSNIYVDFTEGEQIDGLRELGRNAFGDAASSQLIAAVLDSVDRSGDAPGVIARVVELFGQVRAEAGE